MEILLLKKISQLKSRVDDIDLPVFGDHITHNYGNTLNSVCRGNDSRLSDARSPTIHSHIISELPSNLVTSNLRINAGNGMIGGGSLTSDITLSHAFTTSAQSVVLPAGTRDFIKGIQLDTFGHIVAITTGTVSDDTNNYLTSVSGTGNGPLTFSRAGLTPLTLNLLHTHAWTDITGKPTTVEGYSITNVYNKTQIDQLFLESASGIIIRSPVRAATTANITLSAVQTIDGITLLSGDRVLVKNQTNATQNGVYTVSASTWVRVDDLNEASELVHGVFYYVNEGTVNGASGWMLDLYGIANPAVGTTNISFKQFFASTTYNAGTGLLKVGNVFNVDFNSVATRTHTHTITDILGGTLSVANGGTGAVSFTTGELLIGNGTNPLSSMSRTGIDNRPSFPPSAHTHSVDDITIGLLPVARGGTGRTSLDSDKVLVGNGTTAVSLLARSGIDSRTEFPAATHNHAGEHITSGTIAEARLPLTSDRLRKITISTSNPTGGANGDIWFKVY